MSGTEPSSWVAELFVFLSDAAGYLEIEGKSGPLSPRPACSKAGILLLEII